jgi:hypothetical protein
MPSLESAHISLPLLFAYINICGIDFQKKLPQASTTTSIWDFFLSMKDTAPK